jgi:hypothetical protein
VPYKLGDPGSYGCPGTPVLVQRNGKWVVEKCHPTAKAARAHLIALKINVESKESK